MKITFLLPFRKNSPVGGLIIMYEYANHLAEKGHQIEILHCRPKFQRYSAFIYPIARTLKELENAIVGRWFKFNKRCKLRYIRYVNDYTVPDADVIIYTWWRLGALVEKTSPQKGIKINLIQGYEDWTGDVEDLHKSYDLRDVYNLVISRHLGEVVSNYTKKPTYLLNNAIDTSYFKIIVPIADRNPKSVCMLYHTESLKGTKYGIEALHEVKCMIPDIHVTFFGVNSRPDDLPEWIQYYRRPKDLRMIYNQASIFITNSFQEGWGLPSTEAMACGCALISTNIGGHLDYANENTAVLVTPGNSSEMKEAIIGLMNDSEKRMALAQSGHKFIQQFSWDKSTQRLEEYMARFGSIRF